MMMLWFCFMLSSGILHTLFIIVMCLVYTISLMVSWVLFLLATSSSILLDDYVFVLVRGCLFFCSLGWPIACYCHAAKSNLSSRVFDRHVHESSLSFGSSYVYSIWPSYSWHNFSQPLISSVGYFSWIHFIILPVPIYEFWEFLLVLHCSSSAFSCVWELFSWKVSNLSYF